MIKNYKGLLPPLDECTCECGDDVYVHGLLLSESTGEYFMAGCFNKVCTCIKFKEKV